MGYYDAYRRMFFSKADTETDLHWESCEQILWWHGC